MRKRTVSRGTLTAVLLLFLGPAAFSNTPPRPNLPLVFAPETTEASNDSYTCAGGAASGTTFRPDGVWIPIPGATDSTDASSRARSAPGFVKQEFGGDAALTAPRGVEPTGGVVSYFRGPREDWRVGLPMFAKLVYEDLWPGIDLVYSGVDGRLKYDLIVAPGADPASIRFVYRGATSAAITAEGVLRLETPTGVLTEEAPYAFQPGGTARENVAARFLLEPLAASDAFEVRFDVGGYDRSRTLVIDPPMAVYTGYIGGNSLDTIFDVAVDDEGAAYVTGTTSSSPAGGFPVRFGPSVNKSGLGDAFVAKITPDGTELVYCGYIGGLASDSGRAIAVDTTGQVYVAGLVGSDQQSFPVTVGPDLEYNGGSTDAYVACVNPRGTDLDYCGYIGGASFETATDIAVDRNGAAYVVGYGSSSEATFPVLVGPTLVYKGEREAFIAKVEPGGAKLAYCGYIGGTRTDEANGVVVDTVGHAYVGGRTESRHPSFPETVGPGQALRHLIKGQSRAQ